MATHKLTVDIVHAAIEGFEGQKKSIDAQIAELRAMLDGSKSEIPATAEPKKKRKISAAGRRAIAEAQRKRWAAKKGSAPVSAGPPTVKRKMSAAGRKAIGDATRRRWASVKAQKAAAAKSVTKPTKKGAA